MTSQCLRTIPRLPLLPLGVVWVTKSPSHQAGPLISSKLVSHPVIHACYRRSSQAVTAFRYFLLPICRYISINSKYTTLCHINPLLLDYLKKVLSWVWMTMVSLFPFLICWSPAGWTWRNFTFSAVIRLVPCPFPIYRHLQKHLCFQSPGILAQSLDWIGYHNPTSSDAVDGSEIR